MTVIRNIGRGMALCESCETVFDLRNGKHECRKNSAGGKKINVGSVLDARGERYGKFADHADISQGLKEVLGEALATRDKEIANDQLEALEMICHKMARIINGDPNYVDSWVDIAGYAQLVADRLNGNPR